MFVLFLVVEGNIADPYAAAHLIGGNLCKRWRIYFLVAGYGVGILRLTGYTQRPEFCFGYTMMTMGDNLTPEVDSVEFMKKFYHLFIYSLGDDSSTPSS